MYPKAMGDNQVFREDFTNNYLVSQKGWSFSSLSSVSKGVLNVLASSVSLVRNNAWMFEEGFTVRIKIRVNTLGTGIKRIFFLGKDVDHLLIVFVSSGGYTVEVRNGSGNSYYRVSIATTISEWAEIVAVWDPSTTTLSVYLNGVLGGSDNSAGTAFAGSYPTSYNGIYLGVSPSPTDFDFDFIELYKSIWTDEDIENV